MKYYINDIEVKKDMFDTILELEAIALCEDRTQVKPYIESVMKELNYMYNHNIEDSGVYNGITKLAFSIRK